MFLRSVLLQESRNMFEKDFTEKKTKVDNQSDLPSLECQLHVWHDF